MAYEFLATIETPRHMAIAAKQIGIREVVGKGSNPVIMAWVHDCGFDKIYKDDDMSWCALFHYWVLLKAGRPVTIYKDSVSQVETSDKYDYLRALKYVTTNFLELRLADAGYGDTLVFKRPGGGHIGFYVGEDKDCFHVLGGNQGNRVSVIRIEKKRCIGVRRPQYNEYVPTKKLLAADGAVSSNEA